jgi:hypothetical protein
VKEAGQKKRRIGQKQDKKRAKKTPVHPDHSSHPTIYTKLK